MVSGPLLTGAFISALSGNGDMLKAPDVNAGISGKPTIEGVAGDVNGKAHIVLAQAPVNNSPITLAKADTAELSTQIGVKKGSTPAMHIDVFTWIQGYDGGLGKLGSDHLLDEDQAKKMSVLLSELVKVGNSQDLDAKFQVLSDLYTDYDSGLELDFEQLASDFGIEEKTAKKLVIENELFGGEVFQMADETIKGLKNSEGNEENIKFGIEAAKTI